MKNIVTLLLLLFALTSTAAAQENAKNQSFAIWLSDFKRDAVSQGISQNTLDDAFAETQPLERVLVLDRKQPESTLTLDEYLENVVSDKRISDGRKFYAANKSLLAKISAEYGVQARFIVALWGIETNYGSNTGGFSTIDSLATLAFDGRRSEFFRDELLNALKVLQSEHMSAGDMRGSWAGALGQCQFMPSSFLKYAVDYDHDGKHDIWHTQSDVFASIANYLSSVGWNGNASWGGRVKLPKKFDKTLTDIKTEKTLQEWHKLGVRKLSGKALPSDSMKASVIMVGEGADAVPYIIYSNYKVLLQWNRSRYFATAVGTLADAIGK